MTLLLTIWGLVRGVAQAIPLAVWLVVGAGAGGFVAGHHMASNKAEVEKLQAKVKLAEADASTRRMMAQAAAKRAAELDSDNASLTQQLAEIQAENAKLPVEKRCPLGPDRARRLRDLGIPAGAASPATPRLRSPRLRSSTHGER